MGSEKKAVKSIDKKNYKDQKFGLESFKTEVSISITLGKLNKTNQKYFVQLHGVYTSDTSYYMVLDYMKGQTLESEILKANVNKITEKKYLTQKKRGQQVFNDESTKTIMKKLLSAVKKMHKNNVSEKKIFKNQIIHRDLKPQNLLFAKPFNYESLVIADFGLATFATNEQFQFPKCGTPGYIAPEILNLDSKQLKYTEACDIFSCGVIFYRLYLVTHLIIRLTNTSLFHGKNENEVLLNNQFYKIDLSEQFLSNINPDAKRLLLAMITKNPEQRISAKKALKLSYFKDSNQLNDQLVKLNSFEVNWKSLILFQKQIIDLDSNECSPKCKIEQFPSMKKPSFEKSSFTFQKIPNLSIDEILHQSTNMDESGIGIKSQFKYIIAQVQTSQTNFLKNQAIILKSLNQSGSFMNDQNINIQCRKDQNKEFS